MKHADLLDFATELQDAEIENALDNRVRYFGNSLDECVDCGEEIPQARREAIAGCETCIVCQSKRER